MTEYKQGALPKLVSLVCVCVLVQVVTVVSCDVPAVSPSTTATSWTLCAERGGTRAANCERSW